MTNVLSPREIEMLIQIADGLTRLESGALMALAPNTVSEYRLRIFDKLERAGLIHSRTTAALVRYAMVHGFVEGTI